MKGIPKEGCVVDTDVPSRYLCIQFVVATSSVHAWPVYQANFYHPFKLYHQH